MQDNKQKTQRTAEELNAEIQSHPAFNWPHAAQFITFMHNEVIGNAPGLMLMCGSNQTATEMAVLIVSADLPKIKALYATHTANRPGDVFILTKGDAVLMLSYSDLEVDPSIEIGTEITNQLREHRNAIISMLYGVQCSCESGKWNTDPVGITLRGLAAPAKIE